MQVHRVLSRAARSLLAQRTRTVTGDGLRKVWRWSLGAEPNDAAVLEARQYLAADLDVEAIYFNEAHYSAYGPRFSGMWEPGEEAYDPHRLAKQRIVTTPSVGVEVRFAFSATWVDRARRGRDLAVRLGNKTKATVEPLARRGYRAARDRVTREQAVKHLRRAPAAVSDQSGTHTVRASLSFTPEQGVRWETLREQLTRAGVLVGECDDVPGAKADGAADAGAMGRNPYYRDKAEDDGRRCIDPDNTVHLVHPFLTMPLCGKPLKHEERGKKGGGRVFYTADAETMPFDSRMMCDVCGRISASRCEPPVDSELWRSAPSQKWAETNQLFAEARGDRSSWLFKEQTAAEFEEQMFSVPIGTDPVQLFPEKVRVVDPHPGRRLGLRSPAHARRGVEDDGDSPRGGPAASLGGDGARLMHLLRLVDMTGTMHLARTLITDPAALQRSSTYCGFEHALTPDQVGTIYQSAARFHEPTPAGAVRVCEECVRHRQPFGREWSLELGIAAPGESMQDTESSSETDDGDEMPVLKVAHDAKVYLPRLMVQADMVHSQKDAARLINSGQVTIDGKPCVGKLTYRGYELVGFVVELGGEGTLGNLPRIYEAMTHRFGVSMA